MTDDARPGVPVIRGRVWTFGDHIDTDAIIPARYCNSADPKALARHCLEDADPDFASKVRPGDIIVAGENFGCGSSREVAPICLKAAGLAAIVAPSFARIFFRNAINIGLPIFECPGVSAAEGDDLEIDPASGRIRNLTSGPSYQAEPFPPFLQHIIAAGGLHGYVEERLAGGRAER
ncbi:MAG: 3-isopropylmalate dehydratase small subunit [Anaerolineae bacterium]